MAFASEALAAVMLELAAVASAALASASASAAVVGGSVVPELALAGREG